MPAVSKKQQRFFGMVRAAQKGEGATSPEVAKVADEISDKDAKKFAKTKHKGLPEKKKMKEETSTYEKLKKKIGSKEKHDKAVTVDEGKKKGLWDNIHAKRKRGESPAKPGDKDYPKTLDVDEGVMDVVKRYSKKKEEKKPQKAMDAGARAKRKLARREYEKKVSPFVPDELKDHYSWRDELNYVKEGAAWTKKSGKNKEGGLNEKGRKSYERENPGSDLKAPSKEVGNKRRSSFCARMKGMKKKLTSAKTANDPDSRINKSLRAWNC